MPSSSIELTSEQIEQFQNDGAIYLPNVFDTKWVESAKVAIDKVMANPSPYGESLRPVENEGSYFNDTVIGNGFPNCGIMFIIHQLLN